MALAELLFCSVLLFAKTYCQSDRSYVTIALSAAELRGATVLARSLTAVRSKYDLYLLGKPELRISERLKEFSGFAPSNGTKVDLLGLARFKKIVFLECDTVVYKNIDELFDFEIDVIAAPAKFLRPDHFTSSIMVLRPSRIAHLEMQKTMSVFENEPADDVFNRLFGEEWRRGGSGSRLSRKYFLPISLIDLAPADYVRWFSGGTSVVRHNDLKPWEGDRTGGAKITASVSMLLALWDGLERLEYGVMGDRILSALPQPVDIISADSASVNRFSEMLRGASTEKGTHKGNIAVGVDADGSSEEVRRAGGENVGKERRGVKVHAVDREVTGDGGKRRTKAGGGEWRNIGAEIARKDDRETVCTALTGCGLRTQLRGGSGELGHEVSTLQKKYCDGWRWRRKNYLGERISANGEMIPAAESRLCEVMTERRRIFSEINSWLSVRELEISLLKYGLKPHQWPSMHLPPPAGEATHGDVVIWLASHAHQLSGLRYLEIGVGLGQTILPLLRLLAGPWKGKEKQPTFCAIDVEAPAPRLKDLLTRPKKFSSWKTVANSVLKNESSLVEYSVGAHGGARVLYVQGDVQQREMWGKIAENVQSPFNFVISDAHRHPQAPMHEFRMLIENGLLDVSREFVYFWPSLENEQLEAIAEQIYQLMVSNRKGRKPRFQKLRFRDSGCVGVVVTTEAFE